METSIYMESSDKAVLVVEMVNLYLAVNKKPWAQTMLKAAAENFMREEELLQKYLNLEVNPLREENGCVIISDGTDYRILAPMLAFATSISKRGPTALSPNDLRILELVLQEFFIYLDLLTFSGCGDPHCTNCRPN